jgi:hypothetical protein
VFISKEASNGQPNLETPGAVYDIPETLNLKTGEGNFEFYMGIDYYIEIIMDYCIHIIDILLWRS